MEQADQRNIDISLEKKSLSSTSIPKEETETFLVDTLTGPQKVAVLLIAMGKETAGRLIKKIDTKDLRYLNEHIQDIPNIKIDDLEKIVKNFEKDFTINASFSQASERFSSLVQENFSDNEISAIFNHEEKVDSRTEDAFKILMKMSADELRPYLIDEHPQVISYILSLLPDKLAAQVLLILPTELCAEVVHRALHINPILPAVEIAFNQVLYSVFTQQNNKKIIYHHKQIAKILNQLDKNELDEVMSSLQTLKTEEITAIKSGLFSFKDISRLTDKERITLFNEISYDVLTRALRDVDAELKEMILSSLSQRMRRMVESEISTSNEMLLREDILRAQRQIADMVLSMSDKGLINFQEENLE